MNHSRTAVIALGALALVSLLSALVLRAGGAGTPAAERGDAASFYKGRRIRLIVANKPGGGYDRYARLVAPFLEKYTSARVQLAHVPGAGGMRGYSEVFRSPADGLTIGLVNGSGMVSSRIAGIEGAEYDVANFSLIGRIARDDRVLSVSAGSGFRDFPALLGSSRRTRIGATGLGGSTYVDAVITRGVFGLDADVIHGFENSAGMRLALLRGSVDGIWTSWASARASVESGQSRVLVQGGRVRADFLPDIPSVFEYLHMAPEPAHAEMVLEAWESLNDVGRMLVAPPGVSAGNVAFLRRAFESAMTDPELRDIARGGGHDLSFAAGEEMERIVSKAMNMPAEAAREFAAAHRGGVE